MSDFDGWQTIEPPLGEGGQGKVYRARSPERVAQIQDSESRINKELWKIKGNNELLIRDLAKFIVDAGSPDDVKTLGALKVFKIEGDGPKREKAYGRLDKEVNALSSINHPSVLKLLYHNRHKDFIVTEYHPLGTLNAHLDRYRGHALEALLAFKPLVQGVDLIHHQGAIHRDIKTENIFLAADGRLVLGDFGIVFIADDQRTRLTDLYGERVGSHFWMAPWAYDPVRLPVDAIKPTLDIFPLGKVLWSMIAGRNGPAFWEYERAENNLANLFPDDLAMQFINQVLSKCIVRDEDQCAQSAAELESHVDEAIMKIKHLDRRSDGVDRWLCLVCKKGHYGKEMLGWKCRDFYDLTLEMSAPVRATAYFCDHCGHVQMFRMKLNPG
jgi:serine/threonine protein kinase